MSKYNTLLNILDSLRKEAPKNYKKYHVEEPLQKKEYAFSLAYIHLFLKANFNLTTFESREDFITDGPNDGGIDAYYIDKDEKIVYFIQSKFRSTEKNFESKSISIDELSKMDIIRISEGESNDSKGNNYNNKILAFQEKLNSLDQISRYKFQVIILANLENYSDTVLQKIISLPYSVFNFEKAYNKLVFPIIKGTCHVAKDIKVSLNMGSKNNISMDYEVTNKESTSNVQLFFIPTIEIAKIMSEYRNSVLQYNPRSYLGLSSNSVNNNIYESITAQKDNIFSLLNNGLTLLSDDTSHTTKTGKKGVALLEITNPQIINGGETAHTLAKIYEDPRIKNNVFEGKEVLTKVITLDEALKDEKKIEFIEQLSIATNNQSTVKEADRHSNDLIQIQLQDYIFEHFGYYYDRKKGELDDGLNEGYINANEVIKREILTRVAFAINGEASTARRSGEDVLFRSKNFTSYINIDTDFDRLIFSYFVYKELELIENKHKKTEDKYGVKVFGNALRYGKYAVVYAVSQIFDTIDIDRKHLLENVSRLTSIILKQWKNFEKKVANEPHNQKKYFVTETDSSGNVTKNEDFDNYYKGGTVDNDIKTYSFSLKI
ncbi:AIPR family protein [Staphylococcus saprophyticus]|uniref:AIPR family protein n=1 Tax=Staphylococcus saprophyticus TaxID=29385 RepID=UPI0034DD17AB